MSGRTKQDKSLGSAEKIMVRRPAFILYPGDQCGGGGGGGEVGGGGGSDAGGVGGGGDDNNGDG